MTNPLKVSQAAREMMDNLHRLQAALHRSDITAVAYETECAEAVARFEAQIREECAGVAEDAWASHETREQWANPNLLCEHIATAIRENPNAT